MQEIGVGVIGTAFMGKAHSLAYAAAGTAFGDGLRPRLEILCDIDEQRAQTKRTEFGFSRSTTDYMDVINDPNVELISICVPNAVHMEIAVAALKAGKHVWCEKPMATSVVEAEQMLAASRASNCQTMLGYNYTQNPLVQSARQLIKEGAIGDVTGFFGIYDVDNEADPDRPFSWRMSREASGTGANADVMCHLVSMAHFITGTEINRLVADYDTVHKQRTDPDNPGQKLSVDNDDVCMALAHFSSGIKGSLRVSRVAWGRKCGLSWEIHGSQGMICHDQERLNELKIYTRCDDPRQQGFRTVLSGPYHEPYGAFIPNAGHGLGFIDVKVCELNKLLNAISNSEPAWPNFEDGIKIEKVLDAIDRSALETNGLMSNGYTMADVLNLNYPAERRLDVLVLGRAGMDLYPQPDGCKIEDSLMFCSDLGGSAGNIAVALARAGLNTSLISAVSDDAVGSFVTKRLNQEGIDTTLTVTTKHHERTSLALAEVRNTDCNVVIYRNNPADLKITCSKEVSKALTEARNLVVTGTSLIDEEAKQQVLEIMQQARTADCKIWLDLDYRSWNWPSLEVTRKVYQQACAFADVLIGNEEEFSVLTGDIKAQINVCRDQGQIMVLKRGADGASLFAGAAQLDCGVYPVTTLKPYGSGDAFLGNLLAQYMLSNNWQDAITAGSAAAAIVVSTRGCASAMPTPEQVKTLQQTLTLHPAALWINPETSAAN